MRVIARATLKNFVDRRVERRLQNAVKQQLDAWFAEVSRAAWKTPAELKNQYRSASILPGNRAVFNIKGNDYRLIVAINFPCSILFIKWLGTHAEYDKVNALTIEYDEARYANSPH